MRTTIIGIGGHGRSLGQKIRIALGGSDAIRHLWLSEKTFGDGERYMRVGDVSGDDVLVVANTHRDCDFLDLYDVCWHVSKQGAASITVWIPYFGYSTMERAVMDGEVVKAKTRAAILSSIPAGPRITFVLTDLHAAGIQYYFEGSCHTKHHYAKPAIIKACRSAASGADFVLASADSGRAKWVESLAKDMGVDAALVLKRREGADTHVTSINANVQGRTVVIYDDMIRSGGSIAGAAGAYRAAGAAAVHVVCTHILLPNFPAENRDNLLSSVDSIWCTDTLPCADPDINVVSVVDETLISSLSASFSRRSF